MINSKKLKVTIIIILIFFILIIGYMYVNRSDNIDNFNFPIIEKNVVNNLEKLDMYFSVEVINNDMHHSSFILIDKYNDKYGIDSVQHEEGKYISLFIHDRVTDYFDGNLNLLIELVCNLYGLTNESDYIYDEYIMNYNNNFFQNNDLLVIEEENYCVSIAVVDNQFLGIALYSEKELLE